MAKKKINRPKNIQSKESLIAYLNSNPDELPFQQECWDAAIVECNDRNKIIKSENAQPGTRAKKLASPGSVYFELLATPLFKNKATEQIQSDIKVNQNGTIKKINVKDYIENLESPQGQFIYKFLIQYFGSFQSEDTIKFLIERIKAYYGEYELNAASDEFLVMTVITDELVMRQMTKERVLFGDVNNKDLEVIRNGYMKSLDGLKALKKFNSDDKDKDERFTKWVEKLLKEGELSTHDITYEKDQIDTLINSQLNGIKGVYSG